MNLTVGIIIVILLIVLIAFIIWRNNKDEKKFEKDLNNDYKKTKDKEGDIETE